MERIARFIADHGWQAAADRKGVCKETLANYARRYGITITFTEDYWKRRRESDAAAMAAGRVRIKLGVPPSVNTGVADVDRWAIRWERMVERMVASGVDRATAEERVNVAMYGAIDLSEERVSVAS